MSIEIIHGGGIPELAAFIGHAIASMPPNLGQAQLGAVFANIVGNIPEKTWQEIKEASKLPCECGDPDCKIAITAVMEAGDRARAQFNKAQSQPPENPEEKDFSA
jgi:hypothetical protein